MSNSENTSNESNEIPVETFKCTQCNFYTNHEFYLEQHNSSHGLQVLIGQYKHDDSDFEASNQLPTCLKPIEFPLIIFQCSYCDFQTNQENYYKEHTISHTGGTQLLESYQSPIQCSFENDGRKYNKQQLILNPIDPSYNSLSFFNEDLSSKPHDLTQPLIHNFNTIRFLKQTDQTAESSCDDIELFQCTLDDCTFKTNEENDLKEHSLIHQVDFQNVSYSGIFTCTKCNFQTNTEDNLNQHLYKHNNDDAEIVKDKVELVKIECQQQLDVGKEENLYRCHDCNYETTHKAFLKRHMLSHVSNLHIKKENEKFKCNKCNYETELEAYLKRHRLSHRSKHYFRCKICCFETLYKKLYSIHLRAHKAKKKIKNSNRQNVKCDKCNFQVETKQQLEIHMKLKHSERTADNNLHKCSYCNYETNWEPCLKRHIERMHQDDIPLSQINKHKSDEKKIDEPQPVRETFKCNNCDFSSLNKQYLILHLKRSHLCQDGAPGDSDRTKFYECKYKNCFFTTTLYNVYLGHKLQHQNLIKSADHSYNFKSNRRETAKSMYKCSQCDFKTAYRNNLKSHFIKHKKYSCNICNEEVESAYALVKHRRSHQATNKNGMYLCDICGFQSKNDRSLKMHKKTHNPEFKCPDCSFETHSKVNFQNHCINHKSADEVTMFPCPHCTYQSRLKRNLAWHMKRHVDPSKARIFKCSLCEYQTYTNAQLKSHLMVHKSKEEVIMLKCDFCQFETKRKSNMVQHRLRHLKDSPDVPLLSCPECHYTTVAKRHLNKHRKIHSVNPDKMFQCTFCPYKIHRKAYLIRHIESHKNNENFSNDQWQRYTTYPTQNMGVTLAHFGQHFQQNGETLM